MLYFSRGNDAIPTEAWWPPPLDRPAGLSEPSPFSFEDDADHGVGLGARAAGALPQVVPKTLGAKRGMRGCRRPVESSFGRRLARGKRPGMSELRASCRSNLELP
jgi:hypothetical protein